MISTDQAAEALKEANATERRSWEAYNYSQSAPHCYVWGLFWIVGYGGQALLAPPFVGWHWIPAMLTAVVASHIIGRRHGADAPQKGWRIGVMILVINLFSIAIFFVMAPITWLKIAVYWPLLFGAIYTCVGLWLGLRYILVGLFVAAAALIGYYVFPEHFSLWMAAVGGGSLFLTGFWMQRA